MSISNVFPFYAQNFRDMVIRFVKFIDGSEKTHELMIVAENVWWRFFWNPVQEYWQIACHSNDEWSEEENVSSNVLVEKINGYPYFSVKGFEHKTSMGVDVYKAISV
jgi:hypothetical protein